MPRPKVRWHDGFAEDARFCRKRSGPAANAGVAGFSNPHFALKQSAGSNRPILSRETGRCDVAVALIKAESNDFGYPKKQVTSFNQLSPYLGV